MPYFSLTKLFWSDEGSFEHGPVEVSTEQHRPTQIRPRQVGSGEIGLVQGRLAQIRIAEISPGEVGPAQIGPDQPGFAQIRMVEIGLAQVGLAQVGFGKVVFTQIGFTLVHPAQFDRCIWMLLSPHVPERGTLLLEQVHLFLIGHPGFPPFFHCGQGVCSELLCLSPSQITLAVLPGGDRGKPKAACTAAPGSQAASEVCLYIHVSTRLLVTCGVRLIVPIPPTAD